MTVAPDTITGTITLTTGSAAFTTAGVNMLTRAHKPGDTIKRFGLDLVIATITDENTGTLTELCPDLPAGISGNATPVRIRFQPDGARVTAQARNLIDAVGDMVTRFKPADIANPSEIVLYEATANGVHKLTLRPPAALTADRVFVFPDVDYSNITDLFGQWTRASAAGPSSLVFLEDTDEGANKVTLRAAAALGADVEFVMDAHGADLLLRWTRATAAAPASLDFHEDTDDGVHRMRVSVPALTADRLFLLPDADVTINAAAKALLEAPDAAGQRTATGTVAKAGDTMTGSLNAQSFVVVGGGTNGAGAIYSDAAWGMLQRARQAAPGTAEFGWANSAGTVLHTIGTNGRRSAVVPGGSTLYPAHECRAWCLFNGTTGVITGSGNVSSITYLGTGRHALNFTVAMPDATYAAIATNDAREGGTYNPLTTSVNVWVGQTAYNTTQIACAVFR